MQLNVYFIGLTQLDARLAHLSRLVLPSSVQIKRSRKTKKNAIKRKTSKRLFFGELDTRGPKLMFAEMAK